MTRSTERHIKEPKTRDTQRTRAYALPDGWRAAAKGLWEHESGARVEFTGRDSLHKYLSTDADNTRAYHPTRTEAMSWAEGVSP